MGDEMHDHCRVGWLSGQCFFLQSSIISSISILKFASGYILMSRLFFSKIFMGEKKVQCCSKLQNVVTMNDDPVPRRAEMGRTEKLRSQPVRRS